MIYTQMPDKLYRHPSAVIQFSGRYTPISTHNNTNTSKVNGSSANSSQPTQNTAEILAGLNPAQKAAVKYIDGPLLVLAGAGSGKTSVITRKIAWLVRHCGYHANHIAAVTFTNKAAREMKQRVGSLLQGGDSRGLTVCTFHHLGLKIIQREAYTLGRKSGFSIFDDQDSKALLKDLLLDHSDGSTDLVDLYQQQISQWKNTCQRPEVVASLAESPQEARIVKLYKRYEQALTSYNAVDFDDLITLPVQLLESNEQVRQRWQRKIRYLLVDEYQDTNISQYRLVQLLVGDRGKLSVVGDDDQSIYSWRGANPENLVQLEADFQGLKVVKLEQNYRSTNRILRAANQLIDNNPHIYSKQLWSEKGLGDAIAVVQVGNEDAETERICNQIIEQKLQRGARFKDFAVLVRSNHQSKLLELKLQAKQVPYHLTGGTSFFARGEIKDIMCYLRVLVNPDDDSAFLRIVNVPRRKIGTSTLQTLGQYATSRNCSLFAAIGELGLQQALPEASYARLHKLTNWFEGLQRQVDNGYAMQAVREMIDDIDYLGWLHQNSSSTAVAERRMENVHFLTQSIAKELLNAGGKDNENDEEEQSSLEDVIKKLLLRDLLDQQSEEEADDKVQVMTLHASKGLEFPHVFIMGFEEDILPHRNSVEDDNIEEERRLAYVGITRAQQTLTLTTAKQRKQFGELLQCKPSRFLEELPDEDLHRSGFNADDDGAANEVKAKQTLDSLKGLFD